MTWSAFNSLSFGSKQVWLVEISVGLALYHYVLAGKAITTGIGVPDASFVSTTQWAAAGITIDRINDSGNSRQRVVKIGLPTAIAAAQDILSLNTPARVGVKIWQGFANDPDSEYLSQFVGTVKQKNPRYTQLVLECFDDLEAFNTPALGRAVQRPCPFAVYDTQCGVPRASHRVSGTVTALDGLDLVIAEAALSADGFFNGGVIEYGGADQRIRRHVGSSVSLHAPVPGLAEYIAANGTAAVNILPGCTKSMQTCIDRFSNSINHGGFEDISTSPYDGSGIL